MEQDSLAHIVLVITNYNLKQKSYLKVEVSLALLLKGTSLGIFKNTILINFLIISLHN